MRLVAFHAAGPGMSSYGIMLMHERSCNFRMALYARLFVEGFGNLLLFRGVDIVAVAALHSTLRNGMVG